MAEACHSIYYEIAPLSYFWPCTLLAGESQPRPGTDGSPDSAHPIGLCLQSWARDTRSKPETGTVYVRQDAYPIARSEYGATPGRFRGRHLVSRFAYGQLEICRL